MSKLLKNQLAIFCLVAGYSTTDKLSFNGSISQDNIFGSGQNVSLDLNTAKTYRTISLSTTDPYFTNEGVSRSFDLFYRTVRPPLGSTGDYTIKTIGSSARLGVPFTEFDRVFFGIGVEHTNLELTDTSPGRFVSYANSFGFVSNSFPLTLSWQRDSRDSALAPNSGRYQRLNFDVSMLGDLRYTRFIYQHQYFYPITNNMTFAVNASWIMAKGSLVALTLYLKTSTQGVSVQCVVLRGHL